MPTDPIDPMTGPKYVLEGKLVTMGPQGVVPRGAIYIDAGEIKAVQGSRKAPPPGFEDAPRIRTGDTIYPGLIELHNHLCYNAMPLWDVPKRYTNNGQWKTHEDYRRLITKPSQVLGRTAGIVEALVRFVECKCLLGGTTTSQGITLSSAPGIRTYYQGVVRNVEQTKDGLLPNAGTRIANPSTAGAEKYLQRLEKQTCYLQHLSEGTDDTARNWFLRLKLDDDRWAINDAFCGIHSTALKAEDFEVIRHHGGAMVWSPLSNYLLYGQTLDLHAAKATGILMGIGSDWAPSGSKNMLGELKVAWLSSQEQAGQGEDPIFSAEELVYMATINAARILKWDSVIGSIEPGKRADLIAVNGQKGDDYLRLINARETSLTLVVINGFARVGQKRLMTSFGSGTEEIRVGRSRRILNLAQKTTHPLVRDLTLKEATERLVSAMHDLPELAGKLDNAGLNGLLGGSKDADGSVWRVFMDIEEEGVDETVLAAQPLAAYVQPMTLEEITVVDDRDFLPRLMAARNLPEFVKKGLPPLYGQTLAIPESAEFLNNDPDALPESVRGTIQELRTAMRAWGELSLDERCTIVDQALLVVEENYVHLPLKRAMHAVEPVQRLKLLRHRSVQSGADGMTPEMEFHNELTNIFNAMRDLHTVYQLPRPFRGKVAWLPFLIEDYWEHGHRKYMVSKTIGDVGPESFQPRVQILYWNGTPIDQAVVQNAARLAGSNPAAQHARGVDALTIRPLDSGLAPEEEWVTLHYIDLNGRQQEIMQKWLVFEPGHDADLLNMNRTDAGVAAMGVDTYTDRVREGKKILYAGKALPEERDSAGNIRAAPPGQTGEMLPTLMPTVFRAKPVATRAGTYGYIRIFSFNVPSPDAFVDEFVRLIRALPDNGLIIDVRGNPGGHIHAAERILQVLTPQTITPQKAQFINTPMNRRICRKHSPSKLFPGLDLSPWIESIEQSVETGAVYSLGYPITPEEACKNIGQKYYGPVLLIVDALCYSATDIMAAGFKDHGIGVILGTSDNTGAGGANVWSHRLLYYLASELNESALSPYSLLPKDSDLRVAVRRTLRVGPNAGVPVEDLGIVPDEVHRMTANDLIEGNVDLIEHAAKILADKKRYTLDVTFIERTDRLPKVRVAFRYLTRLDVRVNQRPLRSYDLRDEGIHMIDLEEIVLDLRGHHLLELFGFEGEALVAAYRSDVP